MANIAAQARPTLIGAILLGVVVAPWGDHRPRLQGDQVAVLGPSTIDPNPTQPFAHDPRTLLDPWDVFHLPDPGIILPPCEPVGLSPGHDDPAAHRRRHAPAGRLPARHPDDRAADPRIGLDPWDLKPSAGAIWRPCHPDAQDYPRGMIIRPRPTDGAMILWNGSPLDTLLSVLIAPLAAVDPGPPTRLL